MIYSVFNIYLLSVFMFTITYIKSLMVSILKLHAMERELILECYYILLYSYWWRVMVRLWIHKTHPIAHPHTWAMGCILRIQYPTISVSSSCIRYGLSLCKYMYIAENGDNISIIHYIPVMPCLTSNPWRPVGLWDCMLHGGQTILAYYYIQLYLHRCMISWNSIDFLPLWWIKIWNLSLRSNMSIIKLYLHP